MQPVYPPLAQSFRVAGTVILRALIGEDGTVRGLIVDSGHPMLIAATMNAVKTWTYRPTLLIQK